MLELISLVSVLSAYGVAGQFMAPGSCSHDLCTNVCPSGYVLDANGCNTCTCASTMGTGYPGQVTAGNQINTSPMYTRPCIQDAPCGIAYCPSGFFNGPSGCQFCICAPDKSSHSTYTNPCDSAAITCDAVCFNGYKTGSNGCQYCECATNTSIHKDTPTTTMRPTTPVMSKEDLCIAKITECQLQHPHGFMTDHTCSMCVGKDEIYKMSNIPEERQPMIKLSNPCIMGFDVCRIFCSSGYKAGPRSCQYCACKNDNIWVP